MIKFLEYLVQADKFIFNFTYPRFSYVCWAFMHLFIYNFDMALFPSYLILMLIWLVSAWSEPWQQNVTPFLKKVFFSQRHLHPLMQSTNTILTSDIVTYVKSINSLTHTQESEQNIAATKASYNIKDKGLLTKYRDAKKSSAYSLQWMDVIIDWFEKIRNLVQWSDPSMTRVFLILLLIAFLVVTFLPMRFFFNCALFYKFWKGRNWQKKRIRNNREVCKIELANFLVENKLEKIVTDYDAKWKDIKITKVMKR